MRRILMSVAVVGVMAAMMVAMAMPAFAANYDNANCIGTIASGENKRYAGTDYRGQGGWYHTAYPAINEQGINEDVHENLCGPYN